MAKMTISENRLQELIQESIYEILEEGQYDESFGHWLGNKFQTARNKARNFVNDFKAGQNDARERNKDYNPYSIYGDREDAVRRMGNGAYPNYRYDLETRRNQKARGEAQNSAQDGQQTQNNNGVQPHPALAQQQPNKLQQMRAQRQKNIETELFKAGLIKSGNGWKRKDGQANTPEDNALIDKWKRETMYENKKRLQSLINEVKVLKNKLKK